MWYLILKELLLGEIFLQDVFVPLDAVTANLWWPPPPSKTLEMFVLHCCVPKIPTS